MNWTPEEVLGYAKRFRWQIAIGTVLILLVCIGILFLVFNGNTRHSTDVKPPAVVTDTTTTEAMAPRRLDGVLVPESQTSKIPFAVMVENHPDARPVSGLSSASLVIEAPVEGGITRDLAFFAASSSVSQVGPVRSARPYYIDWANGWDAVYFHVGGSPDALDKIKTMKGFIDVNQFFNGDYFWRDETRFAPHNVYTKDELMNAIVDKKGAASSTMPIVWHFRDAASSTDRGDVNQIKVTYGGSFNVTWNFDKESGLYVRSLAGAVERERDGSMIMADNVVVIKTTQKILDSYGRLELKTVGSGEAMAYRDGKKFILRWRRSTGEPIRFESTDGSEFLFNRGKTWIQVTTDDLSFGGVTH